MRILGFDWDDTNRGKLEVHGLAPEDIEDLLEAGEPYVFAHPTHSGRHIALGFPQGERFVLVVFEYDKPTRWVRVVTAYEPTNEGWWREYQKAHRRR